MSVVEALDMDAKFQLIKVTKLVCTEGNSDKVYKVSLYQHPVTKEFKLIGESGRRGSSLVTQPKTIKGGAYESFDKLVSSKVNGKSGSRYTVESAQDSRTSNLGGNAQSVNAAALKPKKVSFGLEVQLSNSITEEQAAEYINSPFWVMQQKFDGERRPVTLISTGHTDDFIGGNRKDELVYLPTDMITDLFKCSFPPNTTVDAEAVGDKLFVFDVTQFDGVDIRNNQLAKRLDYLNKLKSLAAHYDGEITNVVFAESWFTPAEKRRKFNEIKASGLEGVIFRPLMSIYRAGRPASNGDSLKCKFVESITAKVIETKGGRSVGIGMLDVNDKVIPVGNVTISSDFDMPSVGDLVHVRYLYVVGKGGHLIQPVYKGVRTDKSSADSIAKLKVKPESQEMSFIKVAA